MPGNSGFLIFKFVFNQFSCLEFFRVITNEHIKLTFYNHRIYYEYLLTICKLAEIPFPCAIDFIRHCNHLFFGKHKLFSIGRKLNKDYILMTILSDEI